MAPSTRAALAALGAAVSVSASSLADICTSANIKAALPANGTFNGFEVIDSSLTVEALYNVTAAAAVGSSGSGGQVTYCNVTVAYTHTGKDDTINLVLAFPAPSAFENRWYTAGGEGYALSTVATGGLTYGAASAYTDAGYSGDFDDNLLVANGSIDWDNTYMFGYQALGEMALIGQYMTKEIYNMGNSSKLYSYYEGCSDGGRQGMSQLQRWPDIYDGAVIGAPALRHAQQQTQHLFSNMVEYTMDYYPSTCEFDKIVNATIAACDPLDGRTDGVISRSDLCKLHFDLKTIIGEAYYCAASTSSSLGFGFGKRQAEGSTTSTTPAQNGTVSAEGVAVAQAIIDGLHNSKGERAYLSYQIGADFTDAETEYNTTSGEWELDITSLGGEYVTKFVELLDLSNLSDFDGLSYDSLVEYMKVGYYRYQDSLQTANPDLSPFKNHGGKLIHYHGEQDPSVPTASSVHWWQSVKKVMYPHTSPYKSPMNDWYQFYLIPGAAHCATNDLQPGPYPENNMPTMIEWVEHGIEPKRLNATVESGEYEGETQWLCQWPERPLWHDNSTTFDCVLDKASIDSWTYEFPAFNVEIY